MGCPSNTDSPMGSDDIMDCICFVGFEGIDGSACMACSLGTFKSTNGSGVCLYCAAGEFQNTTAASACLSCALNTDSLTGSPGSWSEPGSPNCSLALAKGNPSCHNATIRLSRMRLLVAVSLFV
eukprot:3936294-Rhodomonas_salina.1